MYFGKQRLQVTKAVVGGPVVYHDGFHFHTPAAFPDRIQALLQEIFDVIIYYDYGKDQWGCVNGQTYKNNAYRTRKTNPTGRKEMPVIVNVHDEGLLPVCFFLFWLKTKMPHENARGV
jgi:hypothetical protein